MENIKVVFEGKVGLGGICCGGEDVFASGAWVGV